MKYSLGCRRSTRADVLSTPRPFSSVKHLPCNRPPPPVCREKISEKKKNVGLDKDKRILIKYLYTLVTRLRRRNMNVLSSPRVVYIFNRFWLKETVMGRAIWWRVNRQNHWNIVLFEICRIIIWTQNSWVWCVWLKIRWNLCKQNGS